MAGVRRRRHSGRGTQGAPHRPDLTPLMSGEGIAGGMLTNNRPNLQAWVTHAQSLKPGTRMPELTTFMGLELNALLDSLQTLE